MVRAVIVVVMLAACGRIDFDATARDAARDTSLDVSGTDPSFLLWLKMEDDPTDGRLDDVLGRHPATCTVGVTCGTATAGRVGGQALLLDGSQQQCYSIANAADLMTPSAFTVSVWVRLDIVTPRPVFVTKRYDLDFNSWAIYVEDTGPFWAFETVDAGLSAAYDVISTLQPGVWTHIAVTWDNAMKRGYINGTKMLELAPTDVSFDTGEVLVGCDQDDGGPGRLSFTTGAIDDVRVWSRVLTDAEIQSLAQ